MNEFKRYEKGIVSDYLKSLGKIETTLTGKGKRREKVYELPVAFDIEATSAYYNKETATYYRTNEVTDEEKKTLEKRAWMFIWQMAINDFSFYGRTWEEFRSALNEIHGVLHEANVIIYVHNFAYEFQFICEMFRWNNIFAVDSRRPLYAKTEGFVFKCSYMESGVGLKKLSDDLETKKLVGDLDYKVLRTSETELTKEELAYCQNDVLILTEYIGKKMKERGSIGKIQLTKTGYVREWCREYCLYSQNYREKISKLQITLPEYEMLKTAFAGGFTHASAHNAGIVFDNVTSHDITSSYPTVMCCEMFPMSSGKFVKIKTPDEFYELIKTKCCVFEVQFERIEAKTIIDNILSKSKCNIIRKGKLLPCCKNAVEDNGRIISASKLVTTITNIDFFQIRKFYKWKNMSVGRMLVYEPGYLPKRFIECILHFYKMKTELKDVEGREVDYALFKSMLNSIYGMVVMDIVREQFEWNHEWTKVSDNGWQTVKQYNENKSRFLFYPWGIFVTAYARKNVQDAILSLGEDYIYTDTDSVKFVNAEKHEAWFEEYDRKIDEKMKRVCEHFGFDFEDTRPADIHGVKHPIGYFDKECEYLRFKTLGAKRYMTEFINKKGKVQTATTIAGVGKEAGAKYFADFDMFEIGAKIPAGETGKQMLTYIDKPERWYCVHDEQGHVTKICGNELTPAVHMEDTGYEMTATEEYTTLLHRNEKEVLIL